MDEIWQNHDLGSDEHCRRERESARLLRKSRWWQNQVARGICHYCGEITPKASATMDHIVPISHGGRSSKGNVVLACKPCNSAKKDRSAALWHMQGSSS